MKYKIVLFVSRHKDNQGVKGFQPRRASFLIDEDADGLFSKYPAFLYFASGGVLGETSRMYVSVNARNMEKVRKALITKLVNDDQINFLKMNNILVHLAAKPENALEKKWLFDFDTKDEANRISFEADLNRLTDFEDPIPTPNGYAYVVQNHFDPRALLDKWGSIVSLKKDDMLYVCKEKFNP